MIITLLTKELKQQAISLSNYMVFAVTLGIILFLFFNTFYGVNVSSLDGMFGLFPWLFALVVPAFTMASVAGERQNKTLEFLFAHPISELQMIIVKVSSYTIVLTLFVALTVIVPISFGAIATFDWGVIFAAYGATILLVLFFVSANIFFSSLTTNQFAAFLLSFAANLMLILLGTSSVYNLMPQSLVSIATEFSPVEHFVRLASGNIQYSDIAYFLLVSLSFVGFSVVSISKLKGKPYQHLFISQHLILVVSLLLIVASVFSRSIPGSFDVTAAGYFTLSSGTTTILNVNTTPITLRLYVTKNLPPAFTPRLDDINRVLSEIARYSNNVTFETTYPGQADDIATEATGKGIYSQRFTVVSQTELSAQQGYLGLEVASDSDSRVIPFINQTDDFEFQVMQRLYELTNQTTTSITYITEGSEDASSLVPQLLPPQYNVLSSTTNSVDVSGDIIILHSLVTPLTNEFIARLQTAVSQGSSLIVFDDGIDLDLETGTSTPKQDIAVNALLSNWGVTIQPTLVSDPQNNALVPFNTGYGTVLLPYVLWPIGLVNQEIPLFTGIENVELPWISSLEISQQADRFGSLVTTSPTSGEIVKQTTIMPDEIGEMANVGSQPVVVMRSRGVTEGGIVVVGSSRVLSETFAGKSQNNALFLSNVLEVASQDRSLAQIRSKNRMPSSLTFASPEQKQMLRYGLIGGIPGVVILLGGLIWYVRRKKSYRTYSVS